MPINIILIPPGSTYQHPVLLHNIYTARKAVFIDRLGWDIPGQNGELETDQFDYRATHIAVVDDRELVGYMRLLPTTGPHLLSLDVFAACVDKAPGMLYRYPAGNHIWEVSRLLILKRNKEVAPLMRDYLRAWGAEHGVTEFVAEVDKYVLSRLEKWGWNTQVISKPDAQHPVVIIK